MVVVPGDSRIDENVLQNQDIIKYMSTIVNLCTVVYIIACTNIRTTHTFNWCV